MADEYSRVVQDRVKLQSVKLVFLRIIHDVESCSDSIHSLRQSEFMTLLCKTKSRLDIFKVICVDFVANFHRELSTLLLHVVRVEWL